jgi:NDP-sugar pyrophosphorylase family protein
MSDNPRTAVILAGGLGTRLKPYTVALPKPLMPIGNYPILEIILRQLSQDGFQRVILAVNHQADLIKAYFGDGSKLSLDIRYSLETIPLGTMGPLRLIPELPEHFLVMNGDILSDLSYGQFLEQHSAGTALFTIAAAERRVTIDYGVLEISETNALTNFREKPSLRYHVSMGIYAVSRNVLRFIPPDRKYGVDELLLDMIQSGDPVNAVPHAGYWLDIGRPDDYARATEDFEAQSIRFLAGMSCP